MSFNNKKKILSQILTVCIFSSLMSATTCFATSDTEVNATADSNANNQYNINDDNDSVATLTSQSYLVKKFDFEYDIQNKFDTYKNAKEAEKAQAKSDAIDSMERLVSSDEYSIDEKRELIQGAMSQVVLEGILEPLDALNLKQDFECELNRQADVENLELTISNILSSTVSVDSKREFCVNALELSELSGSISQDYYDTKLAEVENELADQQRLEDERNAQDAADRTAYEERVQAEADAEAEAQAKAEAAAAEQALIEEKNLSEQAVAITTEDIDLNQLQTIEDTENTIRVELELPAVAEEVPEEDAEGFEGGTGYENTQTVEITNDYVFNGNINYNKKDFLALCNAVQHEVGDCSTLSKQMVASVIINRVLSDRFPSSIYEVVSQDNQFTGISAYIDRTDYASQDTIYWCQYVLNNGVDYSNGALFYYAPQWCGYMNYFESMTLVAEHDGQRYFR